MRRLLALALLLVVAGAVQARTLRYASAQDPQSMDPHALALLYQSRVVTPEEAVRLGANYLVVGRSITGARDPAAVLEAIRACLDEGAHA